MHLQYTPYFLPLFASALVSLAVAGYAWTHRATRGAKSLAFLALAITVWGLGYALEIAGMDLETKYLWGVFQYFGIASAPYFWLIFAYRYGEQTKPLSRWFVLSSALIPSLTILLALTTQWHGLIWSEYSISQSNNFSTLDVSHGAWFWVHLGYSYLILLAGAIFLVRLFWRKQGLYRGQGMALLVALLAPWIGNALYLTGNSPIPHLDLTSFAFTVTAAALAWATFGYRLTNISPLAREWVIDSMQEGMIVLDTRGNIVDLNGAAARMVGIGTADAIGRSAGDVFTPWPHLIERFRNVAEADDEIAVGSGAARRRYQVRFSPLANPQGRMAGSVILVRALDENGPQPRLAALPNETQWPDRTDKNQPENRTVRGSLWIWEAVVRFFAATEKMEIVFPEGLNPSWYRTRERIFTMIARIAAFLGTVSLVLTVPSMPYLAFSASLAFAVILAVIWGLGLARGIQYSTRVTVFLSLIYGLGVVEILNFGFSVECFIFFLTFVVASAILTSRRGATHALAVTVSTLGLFAALIGSKTYLPLDQALGGSDAAPSSVQAGFISVLVFTASALGVVASTVLLLESLNAAWQKETQAVNVLRQERDLLEQHITERTHHLAEAEAKYRTLVEQLPVVVYRDTADAVATNNYVSPQIETLLGYSLAEWAQDPNFWHQIIHPADRELALATIDATLAQGEAEAEYRMVARDGRVVWVRDSALLARDAAGQPQFVQGIFEDITARKQAEESSRESEQRYRLLADNASDVIWTTDMNLRSTYISPSVQRHRGYTVEEAMARTLDETLPPESFQKASALFLEEMNLSLAMTPAQRLAAAHSPESMRTIELENYRKDGTTIWVEATVSFLLDAQGELTGILGTSRDITARRQAEEQVRKLSQAVEQSGNSVVVTDVNGTIEYVNPHFTKTTGYSFEEALGQTPRLLKSGKQGPEFYKKLWETISAGQTWRGIFHNQRKDGTLYWETATITPVQDQHGKTTHFVAVKEDVTREKEMEEALRESHQTQSVLNSLLSLSLEDLNLDKMLVRALDTILDIPWLPTQPKGGIFLVGDQPGVLLLKAQRNLGTPLLTMCARVPFGHCLCGRAAANARIEFADCVDDRHENLYAGIQPHGHYSVPILFRGEVLGVLVLYLDVGRTRDPREIALLEAVVSTLAAMIRDKRADEVLAITRDQALEASRFKSYLLSRVSHELRTPLGGVLGYAELMQINTFGALNEKQAEATSFIIESAHYLTHMVNELLDEAQIEAGTILLDPVAFSPTDLLDGVSATLAVLANKKGLAFHAECSPTLPDELHGDANRLQQIIINLAGNAVKFTKEGEVRVHLFCPTPAQWAIQISDTGVGIPDEAQEYIFDPFRQVDNSITRENRGSGLGLSISKQLIELMGGHITLESEVGQGSTFTILLPIIPLPKTPNEPA